MQMDDHVGHEDGGLMDVGNSAHDHPDGEHIHEDVGREETFEDAADELAADGRISDIGVPEVAVESQEEGLGKNPDIQVMEDRELQQVGQLMDELALVRAQLERTVAEKENMACECVEYKVAIEYLYLKIRGHCSFFLVPD